MEIGIVLAFFGTTRVEGLRAIELVYKHVKESFPNFKVRVTFTSNIVRSVWRKRKSERGKWVERGVPELIFEIKGLLSTMDELQEEGIKRIVVQSTHIFHMEQVEDLISYIKALEGIETVKKRWKPFERIVLGRPLFGGITERYSYAKDIEKAVLALSDDVEEAKALKADLLYMAHGSETWPSGVYAEIEESFRRTYSYPVFISAVEGFPPLESVVPRLSRKRILLKPLMLVCGEHALEDMAGSKNSWKKQLEARGFEVKIKLEGLGEKESVRNIIVSHIKDAIKEL